MVVVVADVIELVYQSGFQNTVIQLTTFYLVSLSNIYPLLTDGLRLFLG